jgi:hypothetical protein
MEQNGLTLLLLTRHPTDNTASASSDGVDSSGHRYLICVIDGIDSGNPLSPKPFQLGFA